MTNEDAISREAVIRLVEQYPNIIGNRCSGLIADIKRLPSVTPSYNSIKTELKPSGDCISREEVLKVMCNKCPMYNCVTGCSSYRHIEKMPSVQPQPKRGKWKYVVDKTGHWVWECDDCEWQQRIATNYCPDCGADMEVKKYEDG